MDGPPLKRHTSHIARDDGGSDDDDDGLLLEKLKDENRVLLQDMALCKRQFVGLKKELTMMEKKSREIELVVSLMQRLWSQLDIDAAMILDCLGDSEYLAQTNENSELLHRILQYTESQELEQQQGTEIAGSSEVTLGSSDNRTLTNDEAMDISEMKTDSVAPQELISNSDRLSTHSIVTKLESSISSRSSFTLAILERLLETISVSHPMVAAPEVINA